MDRKAPGFKIADKNLLSGGNTSCGHELHATVATRCNARCAGDKKLKKTREKQKNTVAIRIALGTRKYTKKHECLDEQALTQNYLTATGQAHKLLN
jgi:hypothetical protein